MSEVCHVIEDSGVIRYCTRHRRAAAECEVLDLKSHAESLETANESLKDEIRGCGNHLKPPHDCRNYKVRAEELERLVARYEGALKNIASDFYTEGFVGADAWESVAFDLQQIAKKALEGKEPKS